MAKALVDGGIGVYAVDTAKLLFTAKATLTTKAFGPALPRQLCQWRFHQPQRSIRGQHDRR